MLIQPHYHIQFEPTIRGLVLEIPAWQFRCGAVDLLDPHCAKIDLPPTTIPFQQDANEAKTATLYVVPQNDGIDNYFLDEHLSQSQSANPPTGEYAPGIRLVPCAFIKIPKVGEGNTITVRVNDFDAGWVEPTDGVRNPSLAANGKRICAYTADAIPAGWEALDAERHADAFPLIGLGPLPPGKVFCIEVR